MIILDTIRALLNESGAVYREVHHPPTLTSEDSARERGEDLRIGGKALLLKVNDAFSLFVLSAAKQLDSSAIKTKLAAKKLRFATPGELHELTGLTPGAVPPFGQPILPFVLYADGSVFENEKIAFNAGSLTDSVIMLARDYQPIAKPEIFRFSKE